MEKPMSAQAQHLDPYDEAIRLAIEAKDLREQLTRVKRQAESATTGRDKARGEMNQHKNRAEKLALERETDKKLYKQERHQAQQRIQQLEAEVARKKKDAVKPAGEAGPHATIKSDDGRMIIQLAYNQVHIHEPDRWYMVSSQPLDKSEKHRMIFCGLIDGIMAGDYATFTKAAMHSLAGKWRKENGCQRIEDLDLPGGIVNRLEDAGYELASEILAAADIDAKGVGPASIKKIEKALKKEGLA